MDAGTSKAEYLKKYLEAPTSKKRKKAVNDVTVKYISGDLPETLDAFYKAEPDDFEFPSTHEEQITTVRQATVAKKLKKEPESDKLKKDAELQARYDVWNKGVKTLEETYQKLKEQEYESTKPLARYADDADLTEHLKSQIHAEDPMAEFFKKKSTKKKKKKKKHGSSGSSSSSGEEEEEKEKQKLRYQGSEPPPNRYGIWPGYRWDGVDRSNGFEAKIVEEATRRKVYKEMAQKWSMEDM